MTVAQTIAKQLGGRRFQVMTGATMYANENRLTVKFKGSKIANYMNIEYMPNDTYTMTFFKVHGDNFKTVAEYSEVYCDQLTALFEMVTCLRTSFN